MVIAKNILKRCYETGDLGSYQYRILEYDRTPLAGMKLSLSTLFFGKLIKTKLPISGSLLTRNNVTEDSVQEKIQRKKERQKYYYDRNGKSLPEINVGEFVIFKKDSKGWQYGVVVERISDRSYIIKDSCDRLFRRNLRFIARTSNVDFDTGDLLEENIGSGCDGCVPEGCAVPESPRGLRDDGNGLERSIELDVPLGASVQESGHTEDGSKGTESDVCSEAGVQGEGMGSKEEVVTEVRTRSGRVVRPPKRYLE